MGQSYVIVNLDRREYLNPHKFGNGRNLIEFAPSGDGVMFGLGVLLADGNEDIHTNVYIESVNSTEAEIHPLFGAWAGDRIVIAGSYADEGKYVPLVWKPQTVPNNLFNYALNEPESGYKDISDELVHAIIECQESWTRIVQNMEVL